MLGDVVYKPQEVSETREEVTSDHSMEAEHREEVIAELRAIQISTSSLVKSLRLLVEFTDPEKGKLTQAQDKVSESLSVWKELFSAAAPSPPSSS